MTLNYTYDAAGNRTKLTASGTESYTVDYSYNAVNQLTSEVKTVGSAVETTSYTYDNNGNMLSKTSPEGTQANTYNNLNQLISSITAGVTSSYIYFPSGIRFSKTVGNTTTNYLLDNGNVVGEIENCALTTTYLYGANLLSTSADDETSYYLFNAHGDVTGIADDAQTVTKSYDYDAFGIEKEPSITDENPFRYCGEYFDKETGTYYLRARYYDPSIGRFNAIDPAKDGFNWYAYCYNNPIILIDYSGLAAVAINNYTNSYGGIISWDEADSMFSFQINNKMFNVTDSGYNAECIPIANIGGRLYAEDSDLNYFFFGITPTDTQAGVKITMLDGVPYVDISIPVSNALMRDVENFEAKKWDLLSFASRVGDDGDWNLKYREVDGNHWEETLGISFWGYQTEMLLNEKLVTVEQVGNITYGYLGAAAGISQSLMNIGSSINHFLNHGFSKWDNELSDQSQFKLGINWYNTGVMQ